MASPDPHPRDKITPAHAPVPVPPAQTPPPFPVSETTPGPPATPAQPEIPTTPKTPPVPSAQLARDTGKNPDTSEDPLSENRNDSGEGSDTDFSPGIRAIVQSAPPWLISTIFHMVLILLLGLWAFSSDGDSSVRLDVSFAKDLGVQLENKALDIGLEDIENTEPPVLTPNDLIPTPDPYAAPPVTAVRPRAENMANDVPAHTPGLALQGREKGMKQALLAAYGGDMTTELAVMRGLRWLARYQRKDGAWSLVGRYPNGGSSENKSAATAMALIAFQGAGYTHRSGGTTPFSDVVQRGSQWLLTQQAANGDFFRSGSSHHRLYTHALCTIALCELYGMTGDKTLAEPAQRAVDYCVKTQSPEGGWRYNPGVGSDTSVTGWFVIALQSAKMAGLEVPYETLERIREYLDTAETHKGSRYKYQAHSGAATLSMTAEGLLCRQYLGWAHNDKRLVNGVEYVVVNLPRWEERDVYYWYYAAQVCHHMEGEPWQKWNAAMKSLVPAKQVQKGKQLGSWDPRGDEWGEKGGGRLFVTCLSIYMLEVYYRHLPIYQHGAFN